MCQALDIASIVSWPIKVILPTLDPSRTHELKLDYKSMLVRCKFCLDFNHRVKNCTKIPLLRLLGHEGAVMSIEKINEGGDCRPGLR